MAIKAKQTLAQSASKFSDELQYVSSVLQGLVNEIGKRRNKMIELENRSNELNILNQEAEQKLATTEKQAHLALVQSTSGVRALADRIAEEKGRNDDLTRRLKDQEAVLARERRELEDLKAHYQNKIEAVSKIPAKAANEVPGE